MCWFQQCFSLTIENPTCGSTASPAEFSGLLNHLDSSIVDSFFFAEKGGISWIEFLRGYTRCCGRTSSSNSFNTLFRVFAASSVKAGLPVKVQFESSDAECKMNGSIPPGDLLMLLWMCWIMSWDSRNLNSSKGKVDNGLPDINQLVLSAIASCTDVDADLEVTECDILGSDLQLPAVKVHMWGLKTVPNLPDCFAEFVDARLRKSVTHEVLLFLF